MRDRLLKQANRESGPWQRFAVLFPAGILFVMLLPLAIIRGGRRLDRCLGWVGSPPRLADRAGGGLMAVSGWLFAVWSIYIQLTLGRGTPVPIVATQKLIVRPPYSYCRNPMALGTIVAYLGLSVIARSRGAALLVSLASTALLAYIRFVEEREMVARFGEDYLGYRRRVPFIIPRPETRG